MTEKYLTDPDVWEILKPIDETWIIYHREPPHYRAIYKGQVVGEFDTLEEAQTRIAQLTKETPQ